MPKLTTISHMIFIVKNIKKSVQFFIQLLNSEEVEFDSY